MHTLFPVLHCTVGAGDTSVVRLLCPMATEVCPDRQIFLPVSILSLAHVLTPSLTPHRWADFHYPFIPTAASTHSSSTKGTQPSSGKRLSSKLGGRRSRHERDAVLHQTLTSAFLTAARLCPRPPQQVFASQVELGELCDPRAGIPPRNVPPMICLVLVALPFTDVTPSPGFLHMAQCPCRSGDIQKPNNQAPDRNLKFSFSFFFFFFCMAF